MKFGTEGNGHGQDTTPVIKICSVSSSKKVGEGYVDPKSMAISESWRWVKVYSDKTFTKPMTFNSTEASQYSIYWLSFKPWWYNNISIAGFTIVQSL